MKKFIKYTFCLAAMLLLLYGTTRLYFALTGGFRITHISSDFSYDPRWETQPLSTKEREHVDHLLSQPFTYLGKGCQSYVFLSEDGQYVIKFFKYQRFRPQFYIYWFSFLPPVKEILAKKLELKRIKREHFFSSWVTAFNSLREETGLVYVHLNKTSELNKSITIKDKLGFAHVLDSDKMEFLIQKRADMLCTAIDKLAADRQTGQAKVLLKKLVQMIVHEYKSGFADHDHALMQNTGVYDGKPIHIDVGQFEKNEAYKNPSFYYQELFNKTWKFRNWLRKHHPELLVYLDQELKGEMGSQFDTLTFIPKKK